MFGSVFNFVFKKDSRKLTGSVEKTVVTHVIPLPCCALHLAKVPVSF
jgi:hypothetical protein